MAGTSGFFLKGLAGSLQGMPQRIYEIRWKKKQEDKLQKKQDELLEMTSLYSKTAEQLGADGFYSDDDLMKLNTIVLTGGTEFQEIIKGTHSHITGMNESQVEKDMDLVDSFIEMSKGMNMKDLDETLEMLRGYVKSESALNKLAAYDSLYRKKHEVQPPAEVFPTAEAVREAYPKAGVRYTDKGYVPTFQEPTADKAPTFSEKKFNWKIDQYNQGRITLNQLLESEGIPMSPEKATGLEKQIQDIKTEGTRAGIEPAEINKAIRDKILGKEAGALTPTPTAVENVREDIKDADTVEDARRIEKNHIAKYGETLGIPDVDKFWAEGQTIYLNNIKTAIGNIIDEKGWLKKGTLTSTEVGLDFKGEQSVEEIYKKLKEEYMKYRNMLEKMGIDVSQFPELKPLEEIEKVGFGEGFWGWGKQKGQYKSIYY